jgi:hypothetical protein
MHEHNASCKLLPVGHWSKKVEQGWNQICNETMQEAFVDLRATFILILVAEVGGTAGGGVEVEAGGSRRREEE